MDVPRFSATVARLPVRTATPPPATHTNCYALGARDVLLVEPAPADEAGQAEFLTWVARLVAEGRRPVGLFVTHHHPDHVGGLVALTEALALPVFFHEETRKRVPDVAAWRLLDEGDAIVLDGPAPVRLEVLHTPGHAPGHLCLFDAARGDLVCGDMVASEGTIVIPADDGDMAEYLRQLARLEALAPTSVHPSHGGPLVGGEVFRRYIAHREAREARILAALEGTMTEPALLARAYADVLPTAPPGIAAFAAQSLAAHLKKLVAEGRVLRRGEHLERRP